MDTFLGSIRNLVGFDAATLLSMGIFVLKAALFSLPFLLMGLYLERRVDGRERLAWHRRLAKVGVGFLFSLPLLAFGAINLAGAKWPEKVETITAAHPWVDELLILDGVTAPAVLLAIVAGFFLLNAWESLGGDLSA